MPLAASSSLALEQSRKVSPSALASLPEIYSPWKSKMIAGTLALDNSQRNALVVCVLPAPLLPTIKMCWLVSFLGVVVVGSQNTCLPVSLFVPIGRRSGPGAPGGGGADFTSGLAGFG